METLDSKVCELVCNSNKRRSAAHRMDPCAALEAEP